MRWDRRNGNDQLMKLSQDVAKFGTRTLKEHLEFKDATQIPESAWPIWAKAMKRFAKPQDKGIGDVVARMIGDENSAAFKAWYFATFGKTCGCAGRQARWNAQYPLRHEISA